MLYRNRTCMLMSQNFKLMQGQYMQTAFYGDEASVLMTLSRMFEKNPDMMYQFASEAYKLFYTSGFCKDTDFTSGYEQLAVYGVFLSNLVFVYSCKTGTLSLYTSSYSILVNLASKGVLKGKRSPIAEEMSSLKEFLVGGKRIATSIKSGCLIQAVRLDYEYLNDKLVFKPTIPRSPIDLMDSHIIPYTALDCAMKMVNEELQTKVLKFTIDGKDRVLTKNTSVLNMIYDEVRTNYLLKQSYDARANIFYAPEVGASVLSSGLYNLDLTAIDKVSVVTSLSDIDLSEVKLDTSSAPSYCAEHLSKLSDEQLSDLEKRLCVTQFGESRNTRIAMLAPVLEVLNSNKAYELIKTLPYFDLDDFKSKKSKWGTSKLVQVEVPSTYSDLESLMKKGIFRVTVRLKTGKYKTLVVTNSQTALSKLYGKNYYARFESEGNKLRMLGRELSRDYKNGISYSDFVSLCDKWGTEDFYLQVINKYSLDKSSTIPYKTLYQEIVSVTGDIRERTTVVKQPTLLTVRSCECVAKESVDAKWMYYKNLDIRSIISIVQLVD